MVERRVSLGASAMIGDDDAIDAVFHGQLRVFPGHQALDQ